MKIYTFFRTHGLNQFFSTKVLAFLGVLLLLLSIQTLAAENKGESGEFRNLTEPEIWVLGQINQGKEADLKKRFAGEKGKDLLGSDFLERLFNDGFKNILITNQGVNIVNATIADDVNLNNVEINYPVYLKQCIFKGKVTFKRSYFKKDLSFEGSEFLKIANFGGIKIDGNFICDEARFEDECYWWDARIGLEFQAVGTEFRCSKGPADFNSMAVADSVHFRSKFYGPVSFRRVRVGKQFDARGAKFFNLKGPANFYGMKAGHVLLNKSEFHGPVNFEFMEIAESFWASGAKFLNETEVKNFANAKVGHKVFMDGTFSSGDVDFSYGNFNDLEIDGGPKDGKPDGHGSNVFIRCLNLKGTLIQRDLKIANLSIDDLNVRQMQVKGQATIENVQIKNLADFRNGSFQGLSLVNVKLPEVDPKKPQLGNEEKKRFKYEVYLGELTYGNLSIDKPVCQSDDKPYDCDYNDKDFEKIKDFVEGCPFYTQSYVQLESFFKRIGRESWANEVFMNMNNRELTEKMHWYDPRRWLEWFFWGKIAGYGRAPFRVFFLSLAFIILGACLFDPRFLTNKISAEGRIRDAAIRLIISLDRFLPIELGLAKDWDAKGRRFPVWLYFFLQQVLGWILIPIALASIYSQLK